MNDKNYVLILTVGGTVEPLIKIINESNPDIVYFLHSEDSEKYAKIIESKIDNLDIGWEYKLIKEYQDVKVTFDKSLEVLSEFSGDNYYIHVDFTGGTKAMSTGLFLASTEFNKVDKYTYVGTEDIGGRNKEGVGTVNTGSEMTILQFNPYETYAIKEFDKGMNLFNNYQFTVASKNFKEANNIASDKNYKRLAKFYNQIVICYDYWDKFENKIIDSKTDKELILPEFIRNNILEELEKDEILLRDYDNQKEFYNQIEKNFEFLNLKISESKNSILKQIKFYLPDLLNNAHRRIEEGKYDDAVARLYRAIELIAQLKLNDEGLIDKKILKNDFAFHINKKAYKYKIRGKEHISSKIGILSNKDFNNPKKNTFTLGSAKNYDLLKYLGSDTAKQYLDDEEFRCMVETRNHSILAHGLNPINKDLANELYNEVVKYAELFYPDIKKYMNLAEFPKFN